MALRPSESPNVSIKEFDLSGVVPAVTTSTGALVGDFNWGPCELPVLIGNEAELSSTFGSPSINGGATSTDFLCASYFLKYSASGYVTRVVNADSSSNAVAQLTASGVDVDSAGAADLVLVKNLTDWTNKNTASSSVQESRFVAKYPGVVGNSLKVSICPAADSDGVAFDGWTYKSSFDTAPGVSTYVAGLAASANTSGEGDEVHVAVIDEDGVITGTKGTVLETFAYASLASDAKTADGTSNYVVDVINNRSSYLWCGKISDDFTVTTAASWDSAGSHAVVNYSLTNGTHTAPSLGDYQLSLDQYEDENTIQVDLIVAPQQSSSSDQVTIANYCNTIATARKDAVAITSPYRSGVVGVTNTATIVTNTTTFASSLTASSYLIVDNNFLKVYDKYNDEYVYIPAASSTAGIMAATDDVAAAWFSPAGSRRGQYLGVTSLAYNATKSQRDTLYKAGINPIVSLPGQGTLLYGDKTHLGRPSAFDRINVRRLFLLMERAIKGAAQNVLFEFNDEFTRAEFVNIVEPFLREIKGRRGITDFRVVCDETNNTADVIDNNSFVATVFVKPARSINYVTLNFVAVRTGVDFEEVVGLV